MLREPLAEILKCDRAGDTKKFVAQVLHPDTQRDIGKFLEQMKKK